jgi:hypothetical protein
LLRKRLVQPEQPVYLRRPLGGHTAVHAEHHIDSVSGQV